MSNTYTQIHIHAVFAVKYRKALLSKDWRDSLFKYMATIINDQGHKTLAIGGTENHVHLLFGFRPTQSLSSLIMVLKRETSEWINREGLTPSVFRWQEGFGAFSYAMSQLPNVIHYILNQEAHHAKTTFRKEYVDILKTNEVDYDERYIFDDVV